MVYLPRNIYVEFEIIIERECVIFKLDVRLEITLTVYIKEPLYQYDFLAQRTELIFTL